AIPNNGASVNGPIPLLGSAGAAVRPNLTLWWGSPNTWAVATTVPGTPDGKLMNGYIDSNGSGTGTAGTDLSQAVNQPYLAVGNLPALYQQRGYKVVVYADGNNGGDARAAQYWLQSFGGNVTNSAGADLTPHYFLLDAANTDFTGTYTQVTSTTPGSPTTGNYIVFDGLTAGSFVLRADEVSGGTLRAPINAVQFILN